MLPRAEAIGEGDAKDLDDFFAGDTFRRWWGLGDPTPLAWLSEIISTDLAWFKRRLFISAQFATFCSSAPRESILSAAINKYVSSTRRQI